MTYMMIRAGLRPAILRFCIKLLETGVLGAGQRDLLNIMSAEAVRFEKKSAGSAVRDR